MRSLDAGAVLTVKDLLTLMIIVSDNTATDVLYRMVGGPEAVNRRMQAMGFAQTGHPATRRPGSTRLRPRRIGTRSTARASTRSGSPRRARSGG